MMDMQQQIHVQEITQLQQNITEERITFPASHSSYNPGCQQSSVVATRQRPDSSPLDSLSHSYKQDSTYGSLLDVHHPERLGIWLRPCKNAATIDPSIRKTPSEWALYLEARFEKDPSSKQYPALRFTFLASDYNPMTYEQLGDTMLFSPRPATVLQSYASLQESGLVSSITGLARWARHAPESQAVREFMKDDTNLTAEQKKFADGIEGISRNTLGDQPQQQQIFQVPHFALDPIRQAFLKSFKVHSPLDIQPNTTDCRYYGMRIMSTLTSLVAGQASAISRFRQTHGKISQLEGAGQAATPDLISERVAAVKDIKDTKKKIDAIRNENERNRRAWVKKTNLHHVADAPVGSIDDPSPKPVKYTAVPSGRHRTYFTRKAQLVAARKTKNENMANQKSDDSDRDE
jgi:hypothetical protein